MRSPSSAARSSIRSTHFTLAAVGTGDQRSRASPSRQGSRVRARAVAEGRLRPMSQSLPEMMLRAGGRACGGARQPEQPIASHATRDRPGARRCVPLFAGFSKRDLNRLAEETDVVSFPPGTTIVEEGLLGETMFVVLSGEAKVVQGTRRLGHRAAGRLLRRGRAARRGAAERVRRGRDPAARHPACSGARSSRCSRRSRSWRSRSSTRSSAACATSRRSLDA